MYEELSLWRELYIDVDSFPNTLIITNVIKPSSDGEIALVQTARKSISGVKYSSENRHFDEELAAVLDTEFDAEYLDQDAAMLMFDYIAEYDSFRDLKTPHSEYGRMIFCADFDVED